MARSISFPQNLIDSFRSKEVVGVIGSGLSVHAGFPGWQKMLGLMIAECQAQSVSFTLGRELRSLLRKGLFQEVAGECADLLRGHLYRNFIQKTFVQDHIAPTKLHHLLADLPFGAILTTNYDNLIERTYAQRFCSGSQPLKFTPNNLSQLSRLCTEKQLFIFKMHGDTDDTDTILLTKKDYQKVIHSSPVYQASMEHIFAARTALFIGYGLRDLDLNLILGANASLYKDYGRRHYALFPDAGKVLTKSYSEHYNISLIPYSSKNNYKELQLMMEELSRQVKVLPPSTGDEELQRLKQLIDIERLYCDKLGTYTELERAKFLRSRMHEASFTQEEREFIRASILHGEILAEEKKRLVVGAFATAVSSEFESVLSSIQTRSSLLASQASEGPLRESANEIVRAVERGGRSVRHLQSFGKGPPIDLGSPFNINDRLLKMKGTLSDLIGENEKLVFELFRHSLWVTCVSSMLEQVLMNLAVNARNAIPPKGMITIATTAVSITNEYLADHPDAWIGSFVCVSVSDKGCGISANDLPHIFKPFFSSGKKKGTGLGLYTSRELVRLNGGWIEVKTRPRHGSTFSVFLPEVDPPK